MSEALGKPVLLIVLDGFGLRPAKEANAVELANAPTWKRIWKEAPHIALEASGPDVGLPVGQMGNSEVGHMNLGAGRVMVQDLVRINTCVEEKKLTSIPALVELCANVNKSGGTLHFMGLCSDGGVHSTLLQLVALMEAAHSLGVKKLLVHFFADGRDTPPKSALKYLEVLEDRCRAVGARVATVQGRFYGMDRDKRWERIQLAWDALVHGHGQKAPSARQAIEQGYNNNLTDEFLLPTLITDGGETFGTVKDGDAILFFNYRADRARQLTRCFNQPDFKDFDLGKRPKLAGYACLAEYDATFNLPVLFAPVDPSGTVGEVVSKAGLPQLRIAESEKYAHVTFFFNGGEEKVFPGEDRILVPSPKDVPTYDLKPEMSARELTIRLLERLKEPAGKRPFFVLLNFANTDQVGHTGVLPAAIRAVETVDACLSEILPVAEQQGYAVMITADHGNCETMLDETTHQPHTAHTTNPVPLVILNNGSFVKGGGRLADVGPTALRIMGLARPGNMTGVTLVG